MKCIRQVRVPAEHWLEAIPSRPGYTATRRLKADADGAAIDFGAEAEEDVGGQGALDVFEKLALLAADVGGEEGAEFFQECGGRRDAKSGDVGFERAVVCEQAVDQRERCAGGEEDLLFDFEMVDKLELIAIDGAPGEFGDVSGRRVGGEGTAREDAEGEPVVVLVGERDEAGIAEHEGS
jgi:hypothetical protein